MGGMAGMADKLLMLLKIAYQISWLPLHFRHFRKFVWRRVSYNWPEGHELRRPYNFTTFCFCEVELPLRLIKIWRPSGRYESLAQLAGMDLQSLSIDSKKRLEALSVRQILPLEGLPDPVGVLHPGGVKIIYGRHRAMARLLDKECRQVVILLGVPRRTKY